MRSASCWIGALLIVTACTRDRDEKPPPTVGPPVLPEVPVRGATGDRDILIMLAALASSKACTMLKCAR